MYSLEKTPTEVSIALSQRVRALRRQAKLSQIKMAERSGVSLGSLKRFENSGKISLESLLKLIHLLGRLEDFDHVLEPGENLQDIEELFTKTP
ncbi:MAG: helix-turn-helix transcriptional regulator [Bacteroidota bacterium]